jgi:NCS2 family nucleobase:cation symporter-2
MAAWQGKGFLARSLDRPVTRPAGLVYAMDDAPPAPAALALALQHVAIQSVNFVIPAVLAGLLSSDPADATRFLSLSILAVAFWQVLQVLTRGPLGAGYAMPGTHTAALVGAFAVAGAVGLGFGAVAAMTAITGVVCVLLTFVMHRLRVVLPNEVAGVVVILIGVQLVDLGAHRLGLHGRDSLPDATAVLAVLGSLLLMAAVALSRTRAAPFAVLIGTLFGVPLALALGHGYPDAAALVAEQPWLALPQPWLPRVDEVALVPMLAFLVGIVALKATLMGSVVVLQRASDAAWSRPDAPPIRRALLANGVGIVAAGAIGAACPGPATAGVGLSIATGTLARRIVWVGAPILVVVALCPKLMMLFVLLPEPVKAAMLFYTAGFIMTQGTQLVTARLLDTRRTLIVSFGLCAGIVVAVAPQAFVAAAPVLASPLSVGALVAFLINLFTLPLVARRAELPVTVEAGVHRRVTDWIDTVAGAWALKAQTAAAAKQSIGELTELLIERSARELVLAARLAEDRIEMTLTWLGEPLPDPPQFASAEDLLGPDEARHRFAVWLATRQAHDFRQRDADGRSELRISFED